MKILKIDCVSWVCFYLKDKKGKVVLNSFMEIVNKCNRKPNTLRVDQGRTYYNKRI